jgi:transposase
MASSADSLPTDLAAAHAMIIAQREALMVAEAKAQNAEAEARHRELLIEQMKFTIAKLRHEKFGQSSERAAFLEQLELALADMEEDASEVEAKAQMTAANARVQVQALRAPQAGAPAAARASAARAHYLSGAAGLSVLRRDFAQDR